MRPPGQNDKSVRIDCKHLMRIHERAINNTTRKRETNEEITRLLARLVVLYTTETTQEVQVEAQPEPPSSVEPSRRAANGRRTG